MIKKSEWPKEDLEYLQGCPVCNCANRIILFEGLTDSAFGCSDGKWNLWECSGCHNAYLNPRPTPATIHKAYQNYYTHDDDIRVTEDSLGYARILRRKLANGYRNWRFGSSLYPQSKFGVLFAFFFPSLKRALSHKHRYLPKLAKGSTILDVGFGNGSFLDLAREAGWMPVGVDYDPIVVDKCKVRGHKVLLGGIEVYNGQFELFDAITMSHVIEHVHDPVRALSIAYALLKPGGSLMIDTPNIRGSGAMIFRESWRGLEAPRHLVLFSWESLSRLLGKIGFIEIVAHPRHDVTQGMFAASQAIAEGMLPHNSPLPNLSLWQWIQSHISMVNQNRSEFVTFVAKKDCDI